ncbi:MAG: DUF2007 domain-containing protein [Nitrospirae bacterium]|nr:DUF2007 domain-containing protein [Nitrospirota bacterium]
MELVSTNDPLEAEMIMSILKSGGVTAVMKSSRVTPYPVNIGKMGEIKILVPEEDLQTAREAISL